MKSSLFIISVALVFAACKPGKNEDVKESKSSSVTVKEGELKIGFFNTDSIPNHFGFYKTETAKLENEGKKLEQKAAGMQSSYQSVANEFQRGMNSNVLSDNQKMNFQTRLEKMQQDMAVFQQNEMAAFQEKQYKSNELLMNKIAEYSAAFAKENGFSMFFVRGQGSGVAYAKESMDMTSDFIEYMNQKEDALNGKTAEKK